MSDMVSHPQHYNQGGIECIDAIKAATVGKTGIEAFCVGNAIKYLWRFEEKNGLQDVEKAKWYIERLIKELKEPSAYAENDEEIDSDEETCCNCAHADADITDYPCCECKYAVFDGSPEYDIRPLLFEPRRK